MEIGINMMPTEQHGDIGAIAKKIEEVGFESVWLPEHPIIPVNHNSKYGGTPDGSIPPSMSVIVNPLVALAMASATTTHLKLGTAVSLIVEHNPIDLAKMIATIDLYSGGRFMYGIGTGWFREEAEIMGADFDHRWTQAREYVLAMKELWTKDEAEFHGKYVDFPLVVCSPKPVQKPHPPVIIGGGAKNVLKRIVEVGDGWIPIGINADGIKDARATLNKLASDAGRDPASISITVHSQPADKALIQGFADAGADRVLIRMTATDHSGAMAEIEELAAAVLE